MKNIKTNLRTSIVFFISLVLLVLGYIFYGLNQNPSVVFGEHKISPEISLLSLSPLGKIAGKIVAASCGFSNAGHDPNDYTTCSTTIVCGGTVVTKTGKNLCGGGCTPDDSICPACPNGATNPPTCNTFPGCPNGAINPPTCTQCSPEQGMCDGICRTESQILPNQICTSCPAGMVLQGGKCVRTCPNGATNYPTCDNLNCPTTNVCGQTIAGTLVNGTCTPNAVDPNASCIVDFRLSTPTVNPNGSVEFTWKIPNTPGYKSLCGFVDLTTATPRQIPGLQNLDSTVDRIRISNIQTTTRFCLVCQFYKLSDPLVSLGDAVAHQWVRVLRIGEN